MIKKRKKKQKLKKQRFKSVYYDYNLLAVVILLFCYGLVILYSASSYEGQALQSDHMFFLKKQAKIGGGAIVMAVVLSFMNYHWLEKKWVYLSIYFGSLLLMAMVRFSQFGEEANNSQRWLKIGSLPQFQPSEAAKIAVIVCLPLAILRIGKNIQNVMTFRLFRRWKIKIPTWVLILLLIGGVQSFAALWLTDNLSTALIIAGITVAIVFLAYPGKKFFAIALGLVTAVATAAVFYIDRNMRDTTNFRVRRILAWLHPKEYSDDGGFQITQGLYAIGSGGIFGKGLGNSTLKIKDIPEAQNDMIFTIVCEELGIFGAVLLIVLFVYLLYRLLFIAQNAPDLYGSLMAGGVFAHIALQVLLNICVVTGVSPATGVSLPFVSYGGSSLLFLMIEIGIVLSVARRIRFNEKDG